MPKVRESGTGVPPVNGTGIPPFALRPYPLAPYLYLLPIIVLLHECVYLLQGYFCPPFLLQINSEVLTYETLPKMRFYFCRLL